jgi:hypothetical protein
MAREIPEVVRAVAGLAATVLDEARKLPETLPGLPVRLIGQALQTSLKLQQQYSGLVARGDELLTGLWGDDDAGMATFDDDLPAPPPPAGTPAPRSSAFDRAGDLPPDAVDEELSDALADDLAVADLPLADPEALSGEAAALLVPSTDDDLTPAEVAELPDDPIADAVTALVDDLADEVAGEVAEEVPDAVPDELLADLTADAVAELAEDEVAVADAVGAELIADAAVGGTPPAGDPAPEDPDSEDPAPEDPDSEDPAPEDAGPADPAPVDPAPEVPAVPRLDDVSPDRTPARDELLDDADPDVSALDEAAEELVDLGGPEAAESATPSSDVTDSAATDPLVPPARSTGDAAADEERPGSGDASGSPAAGTSPVEGYDSYSIPALRGRLRGYPAETVADLLDYERATRARAPFVTLLQNRLEKLSSDRG